MKGHTHVQGVCPQGPVRSHRVQSGTHYHYKCQRLLCKNEGCSGDVFILGDRNSHRKPYTFSLNTTFMKDRNGKTFIHWNTSRHKKVDTVESTYPRRRNLWVAPRTSLSVGLSVSLWGPGPPESRVTSRNTSPVHGGSRTPYSLSV